MNPLNFCVVVPAYQARGKIRLVLEDLYAQFPELSPVNVIVVDDGSADDTAGEAKLCGATLVIHPENRGKGAALVTGLEEARARGFEVALTVDADAQHPAASARVVLEASSDPRALVLGVRDLVRDGAPRKNRFSNGISNYFLSRFTGRQLADTQCGLRRYPVEDTLALGAHAKGYAYEAEVILLAAAAGVPIVEARIEVYYPPEEQRVTHFDSVRDPARIIGVVLRTVLGPKLRRNRAPTVHPEKPRNVR
jgi:glycosyltransferase involved in cell wall biosynthesis